MGTCYFQNLLTVSFVDKTNLSDLLTTYLSHVAVAKPLKLKQAFGYLSEIQAGKTSLRMESFA